MTALHRWCIVALGVVLGAGTLLVWRSLPASEEEVSAAELLSRVEGSSDAAYSGYVETLGTLQLPVADQFTDVGDLFGERTRMRVWWRSSDQWRVNKLLAAGETDLIHRDDTTVRWSYESAKATRYVDPDIRLPRTADLLPPALGHRLLEDVAADELSRLPARTVAGRDALGLRVSPGSPQSSIDHVDLWVEPDSGIPLRLDVYAEDGQPAAFTTEFQEFSAATPPSSLTAFTPPPGADVSFDDVLDIADAANQYADVVAPSQLAGLSRSADSRRAVGVYGTGVTQLIAIPLWDRAAEPLREQLAVTPGSLALAQGSFVQVGPLGLLLTDLPGGAGWLVAGTVTQETLQRAARTLDDQVEGRR
ncbi:LolA family protein [Nocardioides sp.]|uniref:LolA family protein n=1 Tax=Nocardioides sp. TaxID=35761 RepID=UPI003D0EE071